MGSDVMSGAFQRPSEAPNNAVLELRPSAVCGAWGGIRSAPDLRPDRRRDSIRRCAVHETGVEGARVLAQLGIRLEVANGGRAPVSVV